VDKLGSLESLIAELSSGQLTLNQRKSKMATLPLKQESSAAEKVTLDGISAKLAENTKKPLTHDHAAFNNGKQQVVLVGSDKWEHEFKTSPALQNEFRTIGAYIAYQKASEKGLIRQVSKDAKPSPQTDSDILHNWENDSTLRSEFKSFNVYQCYIKAANGGKTKIIGSNANRELR
jgi:hypothetical protein